MAEKGLEQRSLASQTIHCSHKLFLATAPSQPTSLLLPNIFPPHFHLNVFKGLSMILAISTSSSPFLFLTYSNPTSVNCSLKAIHNFHIAKPQRLPALPYYWTSQLASTHLISPTFLATLSTFFFACITTPPQIFFYLIEYSFSIPLSWVHPLLPKYEILECLRFSS